ncbi:sulfatase-modifying factor protein [Hapalosiphon sp. MRB220]|nr:sulfatase-modifying factor protein [Hapalosiphon sp. MRB220]
MTRRKELIFNRYVETAKYFVEDLGQGIGLEMVEIPSGRFTMGAPIEKRDSYKDERPQHRVIVSSFFMGKYPITQAQWRAVAALPKVNRDLIPDPSHFKGDNRPVEYVSWYDAVEFCARLSKKTGREYRLPSEAEWEYACRAGTTTPFYFGETITTDLANYDGNYAYGNAPQGKYREETTPVGYFPPNAFGLYDMHGNVWEWCADSWHENYAGAPIDGSAWVDFNDNDNQRSVLRGGSWGNFPRNCRSASRYSIHRRDLHYSIIGFRVVCAVGRI